MSTAGLLDNILGIRKVLGDGEAVPLRGELDFVGAANVEDDPVTGRTRVTVGGVVGVTVVDLFTRPGLYAGEPIIAKQYSESVEAGGGLFYWDPVSGLTHDGGIVVGTVGAGRWIRVYDGEINAAWFGAITAAVINTAMAVATALGGATVRIPRGAYTVTGVGADRIKPSSNVRLWFEPGCTISTGVVTGTSQPLIFDTATHSTIENVRIDGNGLRIIGNQSHSFVQHLLSLGVDDPADTLRNIFITGIDLESSRYDGLYVASNAGTSNGSVIFDRVRCLTSKRNGCSIIHGQKLYFYECDFEGSLGTESPGAGLDIELNQGCQTDDIHIMSCRFTNNAYVGLYAQSKSVGISARLRVTDCVSSGNGLTGYHLDMPGTIAEGCVARNNGTRGFDVASDVQLSACLSEGNASDGYRFDAKLNHIIATNCISKYNGAAGFLILTSSRTSGVTVATDCHAFANHTRGFLLSRAQNAVVRGGSAVLNKQEGVVLSKCTGCTVSAYEAGNGQQTDASYANISVESSSCCNNISNNVARQSPNFIRSLAVVDAATTTTTVKLENQGNDDDHVLVGSYFRIVGGTQSGRYGVCTGYVGSTRVATVYWEGSGAVGGALAAAPDGTSQITIVGGRYLSEYLNTAASTSTTVTLSAATRPHLDNAFPNAICNVVSGTGIGQSRTITGYDKDTGVITISPAWDTAPVSGGAAPSKIEIVAIARPIRGCHINGNTNVGNLVRPNDFYYAGTSSAYTDTGTSTNTTDANRTT